MFLTIDSDDYITPDALSKIVQWDKEIQNKSLFCGVAGNLGVEPDKTPNTFFRERYYEGTLLDRYKNVDGERAIAFYTNIHRRYKYPEYENEKFMTEAVTWNRMAHDGYKMRFYNDIICIYEYKEDGLTKAGHDLFLNNPRGYGIWLKEKAMFEDKNKPWSLFKLYYIFTCELRDKYSISDIASFIGAGKISIFFCELMFRIKHKMNGA